VVPGKGKNAIQDFVASQAFLFTLWPVSGGGLSFSQARFRSRWRAGLAINEKTKQEFDMYLKTYGVE
jgi:hypothetical protein